MPKGSLLKQLTLCIALTSLCFTVPLALFEGLATGKDYALSAEVGKNNQKSLWDLLFGKKTGRGGSRTPFCSIWPNLNDPDLLVIWSDRPLFIWKGSMNVKRIEVSIANSELPPKSFPLTEKDQKKQSFLYPTDSEALKPGQEYTYSVEYETIPKNPQGEVIQFLEKSTPIPFRIMDVQERHRIKTELEALEIKSRTMSAEERALQRAKYFAQQKAWSDVIQEIFLVQNPSTDLTNDVIKKIRTEPGCTVKHQDQQTNNTYQGLPTIVKPDQ